MTIPYTGSTMILFWKEFFSNIEFILPYPRFSMFFGRNVTVSVIPSRFDKTLCRILGPCFIFTTTQPFIFSRWPIWGGGAFTGPRFLYRIKHEIYFKPAITRGHRVTSFVWHKDHRMAYTGYENLFQLFHTHTHSSSWGTGSPCSYRANTCSSEGIN